MLEEDDFPLFEIEDVITLLALLFAEAACGMVGGDFGLAVLEDEVTILCDISLNYFSSNNIFLKINESDRKSTWFQAVGLQARLETKIFT